MKDKWYLKTWFICILFFFWFLYGIPLIVGIILLVLKLRNDHKLAKEHKNLVEQNEDYEQQMVSEKSTCTLATPSDLFKISSSSNIPLLVISCRISINNVRKKPAK